MPQGPEGPWSGPVCIRDSTARNLNKSVMSGQQLLAETNKTRKQTDNVHLVLGFSSLTTGDVCSFQSSMTSTDKQQWIQNALSTTICSTLCHSKSLNSTTHFLLVHSPITKKWAESWLSGIFQKKSPFPGINGSWSFTTTALEIWHLRST